ncbi:N-acetylmannosamine-6-phosphate 2-epimerase [Phormidium yuhuli AB48]|uniref:Putative N-acetylmannosamine-6-phosphate 2-epimerase n=1 Tax=Phormidium yuhuli AB48 TaxID=2940671 RepID=A0ABY5ARF9_9CYAN|nr:N-acetylmannosamine-6-phosphate 2-epimerase [Phormidium yuhuli]USR91486.1 N-acetylmannosamine-6-phosphate 2-epimerase [Phormidium yuhuli AB48]
MAIAHSSLLSSLQGGLIVSCQAPPDSPLHDPEIMAAMAEAAVNRGAVGIRVDSPAHVRAIRQRLPEIPLIGLWKRVYTDSDVYITPQRHHAEAIAEAGADIIALDATERPRPQGETLAEIVQWVQDTWALPIMADIDSLKAAKVAQQLGIEIIGTTLYGYTAATAGQSPPAWELLQALVRDCPGFMICEGGISSPEMAQQAIALGANAVVVGTAITGVDVLVQRYHQAIVGR